MTAIFTKAIEYMAYTFAAIAITAVITFAYVFGTENFCGGICLLEEEQKLLDDIKAKTPNPGDSVRLKDVHNTNWIKVCSSPPGLSAVNLTYDSEKEQKRIVINNAPGNLGDESALIFFYKPQEDQLDRIEVFRSPYGIYGIPSDKTECPSRDEALLTRADKQFLEYTLSLYR
ncbi:MAG: hypothetical protein AB7E85_06470 [Pseudobdellovibrionaceae bacterium]